MCCYQALEAIELCIVNSFSRLLNYMHATYIPAAEARGSSACRDFPDGEGMYQECLRFHTSTEMTADEVHATVCASNPLVCKERGVADLVRPGVGRGEAHQGRHERRHEAVRLQRNAA